MLIPYMDLLAEARAGGYAVGYFEAWDIYSLEAVLDAAEAEGKPIILGFGGVMMEPGWFEDRGMERLGALGLATAKSARVPVSLLLNEVSTFSQVVRGIQAGFNAVMLETSSLPFAENVRLTRKVVEVAHAAGVGVEGELGTLPDATGETGGHESSQTDPEEARTLCQRDRDRRSLRVDRQCAYPDEREGSNRLGPPGGDPQKRGYPASDPRRHWLS